MVVLKTVNADHVAALRAVRLRALQDSPGAFGSTYDQEILLTAAAWQHRIARFTSHTAVGYLAFDGETAQAIAGGLLDASNPARAELVSMWVAPDYRRTGVGKQLVNAVADWATAKQAQALYLMVTSANQSAIAFYQRLGFTKTGRVEPYPNDARWMEDEMMRPLAHPSSVQIW